MGKSAELNSYTKLTMGKKNNAFGSSEHLSTNTVTVVLADFV
jgi:hypothetical protein